MHAVPSRASAHTRELRITARGVAVGAALAALSVCYALHVLTPLRIESDSTEYLVIAAWIADGHGIPLDASFPPGLPLLLAGLDSLGLAHSSPIVLMNLVFLVAGLAAVTSIVRRDLGASPLAAAAVCVVTLLSFPVIRTVPHPLSEVPFFGVALSAVALASAARRSRSYALFGGAAALTAAACSLRTMGFALVPMLFVALPARRAKAALAVVLVPVFALGYAVAAPGRYASDAEDKWASAPISTFAGHLWNLVRAVGELAVNTPHERVPYVIEVDILYGALGLMALVPIVIGAWRVRRAAPVAVTFVASLAAVLVAWPFVASRLLMPAVPLLVVFAAQGLLLRPRRSLRLLARAWPTVFVAAGVVVIAVSLRITFAGDRFPEEYNANLRPTYRVAWGAAIAGGDVSPHALWALRRYEPRAVGSPGPAPHP
jgi:hypothetical protein